MRPHGEGSSLGAGLLVSCTPSRASPEEVQHGDVTTPISRARNVNYGWPVLRSIPP